MSEPRTPGLSMSARIAERDLDLRLEVAPGEVLAVLGPNGAGKSSLLDVIAGLIVPDEGWVRLGDRTLTDSAKDLAVPPHRRGISLLAQDPLLFPHLSVRDNVAFGPRSRGARNRAAQRIAADWLAAVDATELAGRHPGALSGGQAQRVALARALAVDPDLLLLDEPMSALDVDVAPAMRTLLRRVLRDEPGRAHPRCAVLVTHDIIDAITLADRVVVLEAGRIVESGAVTDVMTHPRSTFAARIAGLNLLHGIGVADGNRPAERAQHPDEQSQRVGRTGHDEPELADERASVPSPVAVAATPSLGAVQLGDLRIDGCVVGDFVPGSDTAAVFSPAAVAVFAERPGGSPRNVFAVEVAEIADHGGIVRIRGDAPQVGALSADLTPAAVAQLGLTIGARVFFAVKATEVRVYAC
ncbi:sulfate/molybdate ABC transporter ATP-binding protein [Nocardia asteroides]|uniref:sulfate/molybdate ABC transporter ATP-binding protein n=1 Tax=Nocardia asteroides TaxID=1824 RepID=UPI00343BAC2E